MTANVPPAARLSIVVLKPPCPTVTDADLITSWAALATAPTVRGTFEIKEIIRSGRFRPSTMAISGTVRCDDLATDDGYVEGDETGCRYLTCTELIRVPQFAKAVRVPPHEPRGAVTYCGRVQLWPMYSDAIHTLPFWSGTAAP